MNRNAREGGTPLPLLSNYRWYIVARHWNPKKRTVPGQWDTKKRTVSHRAIMSLIDGFKPHKGLAA